MNTTVVKVRISTEMIHGIEMVSVIGHVGNGKSPIAKIVMGIFPMGTAKGSDIMRMWQNKHPETIFEM